MTTPDPQSTAQPSRFQRSRLYEGIKSVLHYCRQRALYTFELILFPTNCPLCDRKTVGVPLCEECRTDLLKPQLRCQRCARKVGPYARLDDGCSRCRDRPLGFDAAIALGTYRGRLRELCLKLKHEPNAWISYWIFEVLVQLRRSYFEDLRAQQSLPPVVVSIPQHWIRKLSKVFYNQSEELAIALSKLLKLPRCSPLRRVRATRKLAFLSRTQRAKEMQNAFVVRGDRVKGRHVLLVDDILTTGATCGAAARALKKAGAQRVTVVIIARSEGRI